MPKTLRLTNVSDGLYERLELSARANHRSLNCEAIACIEKALQLRRVSPGERLARARALRATLPKADFQAKDIDPLKREGRA